MRPILHTLPGGGSPFGWSSHECWLGCTMCAHLDQQARALGQDTSSDTLATRTGTIYHAFHEMAAKNFLAGKKKSIQTEVIEFSHQSATPWINMEQARQEAERLFGTHRARHRIDLFGRIEAVEMTLPRNQKETDILAAAAWNYSGEPISIKIDQLVKVDQATSRRIANTLELNIPPGRYIRDYKTGSGRYGREYYEVPGIQKNLYQMVWNELNPRKQVSGFIIDEIRKTNAAPTNFYLLRKPTKSDFDLVASQLDIARQVRQEEPWPNTRYGNCWSASGPCKYMGNQCEVGR